MLLMIKERIIVNGLRLNNTVRLDKSIANTSTYGEFWLTGANADSHRVKMFQQNLPVSGSRRRLEQNLALIPINEQLTDLTQP